MWKVGDVVEVISKEELEYIEKESGVCLETEFYFIEEMKRFCGKIGKIVEIHKDGAIVLDFSRCLFSESLIKPIVEAGKKYKVRRFSEIDKILEDHRYFYLDCFVDKMKEMCGKEYEVEKYERGMYVVIDDDHNRWNFSRLWLEYPDNREEETPHVEEQKEIIAEEKHEETLSDFIMACILGKIK